MSEIGLFEALRTTRAVRRLDARKIDTAQMPVVLEPRISNMILGALAGCINGQMIARGSSLLRDDMATSDASRKVLVYLGDYVDRGPYSRETLDLILDADLSVAETVCLAGNHEQTMLDFIAAPDTALNWLDYGGIETLESYDIDVDRRVQPLGIELLDRLVDAGGDGQLAFANTPDARRAQIIGEVCERVVAEARGQLRQPLAYRHEPRFLILRQFRAAQAEVTQFVFDDFLLGGGEACELG